MPSFPVKPPKVLNWQRNHKYFSTSSRQNTKQLFVWGRGDQGQLGLGNNVTLCSRPNYMDLSAIIQKDEHIKKITCGMNHTIFTTSRGGVLSFGVNEHGELGLGDFENRFTPQRIELLQNKTPTLVSCGGHHTLCATESSDGMQVYAWGKNSYGQLGLPKSIGVCKPQEISSLRGKPISAISAGDEFSVVATSQEVLVFGRCDVGQNGQGIDQEESVARIPLSGVIRLSSGWGHTLALTKDGTVWSWGANLHSQCGTGQKTFMSGLKQLEVSNITSIACGSCHSMLLSQSGEVWIFGSAADGKMLSNRSDVLVPQLVPLSELGRTIAIASGSDHLVVLGEDGSLRLWGFGQHGVVGTGELDIFNTPQKLFPPPHTVFSSISCGMDITAALVSPPSS